MKELTKEEKTECLDFIIKYIGGTHGYHICTIETEFLCKKVLTIQDEIGRLDFEGLEEEESEEVFPELHALIMEQGQRLLIGYVYKYGDPWNYFVRTRDCRAFKIKVLTEFRKSLNL